MRLVITPPTVQCSHHPQSFATISLTSPSSIRRNESELTFIYQIFLPNPHKFTTKKRLSSDYFNQPCLRLNTTKRSCSTNLDEVFNEESAPSFLEPIMLGIIPELPEWPERDAIIRANIERKANSVDIPLSLRIIKKKQQWKEGFRDIGESSVCSVKRAFSSMVFIILELQSCALQMREVLCKEDLEKIIAKVRRQIQVSFVWLFRQVFSQTPVLMIYVMILLANFSIYSMSNNVCFAAEIPFLRSVTFTEQHTEQDSQIAPCPTRPNVLFGRKVNRVVSQTVDMERHLGRSSLTIQHPNDVPVEISRVDDEELRSEVELRLWNSIEMQAGFMNTMLDHEVMQRFVSPVSVELEPDDYVKYFRTDLLYQMSLSQDPNNPLLLCNYAQFLHLVAHDYDRAEECYKRAVQVEPPDAESLSRYANFLWMVRKDLWGAEERYLQAMAAEPDNPYHPSKYANFLWSTGSEETYFPRNTFYKINSQTSNS